MQLVTLAVLTISSAVDPHDGPMPMDYFTWVVVGPDRLLLVDTGFTAEVAARRKRTFLRCPIESLRLLDIDADAVTDVVLTHLHYDHVGNFHKLPHAASISRKRSWPSPLVVTFGTPTLLMVSKKKILSVWYA